MSSVEKVLERIGMEHYRWLDIQYVDVFGFLKRITIPASKVDKESFKEGILTVDHEQVFHAEGDPLVLIPDPETFAVVPWEASTVRMVAHTDSPMDPRKRLKEFKDAKKFKVGSEVDFYVVDALVAEDNKNSSGIFIDSRELATSQYNGVFEREYLRHQTMNGDLSRSVRMQISDYCDLMGIGIYSHTHEKGRMQQEIALEPMDVLYAADSFVGLREIAKNTAMMVGAFAVFAPKINNYEPRNEAHINVSMWKGKSNLFLDLEGKPISEEGMYFLGGIYDHIASLSAFLLSTPMSYKELIGSSDQPLKNVLRIPRAFKGESDKRVELRWGDSAMNPYLAYLAVLSAGLDGIKNKIAFPNPKEITLPNNLEEALEAVMSDHKYLKDSMGDDLLHSYVDAKEREVYEMNKRISSFEITKYENI